jgi:hypothetical protein
VYEIAGWPLARAGELASWLHEDKYREFREMIGKLQKRK